jgi:(p)ppGpp synthase/HD superfamily hydrolase
MYSPLVERALAVAIAGHSGQMRKASTDVPYAVHPAHMAIMLAQVGLDETTIAAAILHDVLEDVPGWSAARMSGEFGSRVAAIVAELSEDKSRSWNERKRWQIERAPHLSPEAAAVKAVDLIHNLRTLAAALRGAGAEREREIWTAFKGGREATLRMTGALALALEPRLEARLARALRAALADLAEVAGPTRTAPACP